MVYVSETPRWLSMHDRLTYRCVCRKLSNGETESAKSRAEDSESDQNTTPSKDGTLVIRQVRDFKESEF